MRAAAVMLLLAACKSPSGSPPPAHPPPVARAYAIADLVGGWRWLLRTQEQGTTRVEDEQWRFRPGPVPTQLVGRYVRTVEVRSDDRVPFGCNQRPWYRQRAVFDVTVELTAQGFAVHEMGYRAEPSPCDHGFRHTGDYTATQTGDRLALAWPGGRQTLLQVDDRNAELPDDPWASSYAVTGAWRWDSTSYDDDGNLRDETEWWDLVKRTDTTVDGTYRRRVTVRSPDGKNIACAHAPSWSFDDAYVFDGQREEEHWHFYEKAADPGDHPCLRTTPHRSLDEATGEQIGDYLVLEWRGKRRQILYRPERLDRLERPADSARPVAGW